MTRKIVILVVIAVVTMCASAFGQTASDFWKVNLRFEGIRTDMSLVIDSGEGAAHIKQQQIILSGADNYRARTRAMMVYLQILSYVSEPSKVKNARLDVAATIQEEIPMDRKLATAFAKMGTAPYGDKTQRLAIRMSEAIAEMVKLEDGLIARLKNTSKSYDWIGE